MLIYSIFFDLLTDIGERHLFDANMDLSVSGRRQSNPAISAVSFIGASDGPYQSLLHSFPELINFDFAEVVPTHSIKCFIEIKPAPVFSHPPPLLQQRLKATKEELNHALQLEIVCLSSSP